MIPLALVMRQIVKPRDSALTENQKKKKTPKQMPPRNTLTPLATVQPLGHKTYIAK